MQKPAALIVARTLHVALKTVSRCTPLQTVAPSKVASSDMDQKSTLKIGLCNTTLNLYSNTEKCMEAKPEKVLLVYLSSAVKNLKLHENFKFEPIEAFLCPLWLNSNNVDNVFTTIKCKQIWTPTTFCIFLLKKIQLQNWMLAFPFGFIYALKAIQSW